MNRTPWVAGGYLLGRLIVILGLNLGAATVLVAWLASASPLAHEWVGPERLVRHLASSLSKELVSLEREVGLWARDLDESIPDTSANLLYLEKRRQNYPLVRSLGLLNSQAFVTESEMGMDRQQRIMAVISKLLIPSGRGAYQIKGIFDHGLDAGYLVVHLPEADRYLIAEVDLQTVRRIFHQATSELPTPYNLSLRGGVGGDTLIWREPIPGTARIPFSPYRLPIRSHTLWQNSFWVAAFPASN